ncbi:MAG: hypothetical protein HUJ26_00325 [Planctomycetaceae bacterium]|nr:hypothetical protein [Planctomycetaceae bacterium]
MKNLSLALCRFCLCSWVGAAALFVTAGVAEIKSNQFDSLTVNQLVSARFPHYYRFGFTLVGVGSVCSFLSLNHSAWTRTRGLLTGGLLVVAFIIMLIDYFAIFLPLLEMMQSTTLDSNFEKYHEASKNINMVSLSLVMIAAWIACWPGGKSETPLMQDD